MSLKKSDKIIAIIGVIILIIAGIGIVLYTTSEENETSPTKVKENVYKVTWIKNDDSIDISGEATKKKDFTDAFTMDIIEDGFVLTNVYFNVTWRDHHTLGKLINTGKDKLTATIGFTGEEGEKLTSTGKSDGSEKLSFTIFDMPSDETIEDETIETETEARQLILDEYSGMNTASFDIKVHVKTGEKLLTLRPRKLLNYLLDKGNDFTITVSYEFYEPVIEEINNDDGMPPTSSKVGSQTWAPMAYPGKN